MIKVLILFVCLLLKNSVVISVELVEKSFVDNQISRYFAINKPQGNKLKPLIIALHGGGSSWQKFAYNTTKSNLLEAANDKNALIVFPQAHENHWNDGRKHLEKGIDDVAFISKLIDYCLNNYQIDKQKIYVVGFSNGGFMSIRLAIELPDKIAGIATISAQLSDAIKNKIMKSPVSFLLINSTQDPIVPYNGGEIKPFKFSKSRGFIRSTEQTLAYFLKSNQCADDKEFSTINNKKFDKTSLTIEQYLKCNKSKVKLITVNGGGHTWPSGKHYLPAKIIGRVSYELDAGKEVVDFFLNQ